MSLGDARDSDRQLTTFPAAFPDEQEVTVNQVISSLLKTVKAKFTTPAPNVAEPSLTISTAQGNDAGPRRDGLGLGISEGFGGWNGLRHEARAEKPHPLRMAHSNFSEDSGHLPFPKSSGPASPLSSIQKPVTISGAPNPRSTLSSRAPAPPLVSITPIIRSRDFGTNNEDSRLRNRAGPHGHVKNTSIGSLNRARRPSLSGISLSPSTTSISGFGGPETLDFTNVPGFSIADDARSLRTVASVKRTGSVSKIIRRLRGEGLSKNYWMADENCHECYDCKSVFSTWRRKHHCRICGQIFCSRCAPNIIKGVRFGHDGMVRVCNLCLEIMDECDDDDDKRSVTSNTTSHFPHSAGAHMYDGAYAPPYGQSPFAASQLFARGLTNENLNSISEAGWTRRNSFEDDQSQPGTPSEDQFEGSRGREKFVVPRHPLLEVRSASRAEAAPFRRGIAEEDREQETGPHPTTSNSLETVAEDGLNSAPAEEIDVQARPRAAPQDKAVIPSIAYTPVTVVGEHASAARPKNSYEEPNDNESSEAQRALQSAPVSFSDALNHQQQQHGPGALRSRLSSRLSTSALSGVLLGDGASSGVWRSRADSLAFQPDMLQGPSMQYFRKMLKQAIARERMSHAQEWEDVLGRLLLKVSTHLAPNIKGGDSMDVRKYVKIKKIPGGKIHQSEYVEGTVITKNVAHKQMARHMINPRIMVLTFPLDYHRVENQFMSLEPLLRQERNYLKHLTKRVIDVRPHLVLVERSVSRLALDFLLDAKISVARGVKTSATHQVARCTQADVIASMDRLALEPRLGRCTEFRIQTFEHPLIPGYRKTYMRFEGCPLEFGCTLIIRGADMETLRKVKRITEFMALAVTNLKLEICLFYDEFNILPPDGSSNHPSSFLSLDPQLEQLASGLSTDSVPQTPTVPSTPPLSKDRQDAKDQADRITAKIRKSLEPYLTTALSISASVHYDPPAPLAKMGHLDDRLRALRTARDEAEAQAILLEETQHRDPVTVIVDRTSEGSSASDSSQSTSTSPEKESTLASSISTERTSGFLTKQRPKDLKLMLRRPEEIRSQSAIAQTEYEHAEQFRLWAWYINRNPMDVRPENFQGFTYLASLVCEGQDKPCTGPVLESRTFYSPDDCTLGQYIEGLAAKAAHVCPNKTCNRLQLHHFQILVHGNTRLQIAIDQFPCPSPGNEDQIITWSYCKICKEASPTAILKEQTWKYSWAKYLEHAFYPPQSRGGFTCPHDIYRDQIRYFGHRHLAIRIHNEVIDVFDVIRPTVALHIKQETRVILKNQEYESILSKTTSFFDSVLVRLRSLDSNMVQPEKLETLRKALDAMGLKAEEHREALIECLDKNYRLTPITDVLALNVVYQSLQDKVVQWDTDFQELEKQYLPSETDLRRMTATHLKKLFANQDMFGALDRNISGMTVSEVDETESQPDEPTVALDISAPDTPCPEPNSQTESSSDPSLLTLPGAAQSELCADEDQMLTPCAEHSRHLHLGVPSQTAEGNDVEERTYDSDSTISAIPRASPGTDSHIAKAVDSEAGPATDSDANGFISRLPRRSKPSPTVADLVRRFQSHSPSGSHESNSPDPPTLFRPRRHDPPSDSEQESIIRPKLRRGRTEGTAVKNKAPLRASSVFSDGDGSYAANASRLPIMAVTSKRPHHNHRHSRHGATSPSPTRHKEGARHSHIEDSDSYFPSPAPIRHTRASIGHALKHLGDIRKMGKGRAPVRSFIEEELNSPKLPAASGSRSGHKRSLLTMGSNKVNSIARHFDRLQKDAERDRQKRMSAARGKRARPVGPTKAKVQVFSNARDAFKDEDDSDSSNADDEDDDEGEGDESGKEEREGHLRDASIDEVAPDSAPPSAPVSAPGSPPPPETAVPPLEGIDMPPRSDAESKPLFEPASLPRSDAGTDISFQDRLQITLPPFDTSTPLLTVPPTPLLSAAVEGAGHASQFSESEQSTGGPERSSILKTLSGLWAFRTGDFTPLEYPLSAAEHVFADSRIIIREDEPTSIISFTLASRPYRDKLRSIAHQQRTVRKVESFMPDGSAIDRDASSWDVVSLEEVADYDDPLRREGGTHLKYDFESGNSTIFCRIFFAEQFAALRSACGCEDSFLDSLARCIKWDSSGGKSGSAFLKTKDDRFIAKEVSRLEMDALTKFAPSYFEYMRQSLAHNRPTALAKIYGFFKIGYRNATSGRSLRMNVLVMENLFYERRFERIYDLKGSTRNRLVQATGRENEVLLDENLMEICNRQPLYMRDHTNKILRTALWNDTLFLASLNVMDYSLVVGVDAEKKELVVGVVDYIRTFTWDKKLESWVKDLGGAGRGEPTIVTPKQYKVRFRNAMEKYFPAVPDIWTKRGKDDVVPVDDDVAHSI